MKMFFSSVDGLSSPSGDCAAGWYCPGSAYMARPFAPSNATYLLNCSCPAANYTGKVELIHLV